MKVLCRTLFDCTFTGVTGYFRENQLPLVTKTGLVINTSADWNRARNQHRNWEALLQVVSLRTQPMNVVYPTKQKQYWCFEFEVEAEGVLSGGYQTDELSGLVGDCKGVPMITGLDESTAITSTLHAEGQDQNIWFEAINKSLESSDG